MKKSLASFFFLFAAFPFLFAESKNALLIANSSYKNFGGLSTPIKEARDLKDALEQLGFTVKIIENGGKEKILDELYSFQKKIERTGGIAFFHYGGHAVQVRGKNYLIPVDADIPDEGRVATRAVDVDEVMECMKGETNIIILDACRNNPLPASGGRSATRGLALSEFHPRNSVIVYSAQPGKVAQDGVFTPIFTEKITERKSFSQILMEVRKEVRNKTNYEQSPGEYNELEESVFLAGRAYEQDAAQFSSGAAKAALRESADLNAVDIDAMRSDNIERMAREVIRLAQIKAGTNFKKYTGSYEGENVLIGDAIELKYGYVASAVNYNVNSRYGRSYRGFAIGQGEDFQKNQMINKNINALCKRLGWKKIVEHRGLFGTYYREEAERPFATEKAFKEFLMDYEKASDELAEFLKLFK